MNMQLKIFLSLLNKNNLEYWIDSGTLLGVIREGDVLKGDKDIDIGIHYKENNKLLSFINQLVDLGYNMRYELYNGIPVKYKFYPKDRQLLKIDINIYQQKGEDYLWSPVSYFRKSNKLFFKQYQKIIKFFWRRIFNFIDTNKFPYNTVKDTYTWIIPYKFYSNIIYYEKKDCYLFDDFQTYLKYRYGDWETPNKDWNLFLDDGGINKDRPEKLI